MRGALGRLRAAEFLIHPVKEGGHLGLGADERSVDYTRAFVL